MGATGVSRICYGMTRSCLLIVALLVSVGSHRAVAQSPAPLGVGATAPDFTLPGATRYGVLARPIHLSDFRGKIVVLAFFFKARTKG